MQEFAYIPLSSLKYQKQLMLHGFVNLLFAEQVEIVRQFLAMREKISCIKIADGHACFLPDSICIG